MDTFITEFLTLLALTPVFFIAGVVIMNGSPDYDWSGKIGAYNRKYSDPLMHYWDAETHTWYQVDENGNRIYSEEKTKA